MMRGATHARACAGDGGRLPAAPLLRGSSEALHAETHAPPLPARYNTPWPPACVVARLVAPQRLLQAWLCRRAHGWGAPAAARTLARKQRVRCPPQRGAMSRMGSIPARLKPFALKFFFSNQYLYAHVQRRADGVVRHHEKAERMLRVAGLV
jgi:hypothetical protein